MNDLRPEQPPSDPTIVALCASKGGVGKTTAALGLAGESVHQNMKTLVVDFDTQANASKRLLRDQKSDEGQGVKLAVIDGFELKPVETSSPNLWVCPAGKHTQDLSEWLIREALKWYPEDMPAKYAGAIEPMRAAFAEFDFVIIDCPPSEQSRHLIDFVFALSTHLLLPTKVDDDSAEAVSRALSQLVRLSRRGVAVADPIGILINDCDAFGRNLRVAALSKFDHFSSIVKPFDNYIEHRSGPCTYSGREKLLPRQFLAAAEVAERDGYQVDGESARSPWAVQPARNFVNDFERVFAELQSRLADDGEAA